ncbi:MAG TPA: amino acid adenylation domain-containing protein [Ktedonobacterales bacterium]|jgi:amino acid adenylation domain-containing protein
MAVYDSEYSPADIHQTDQEQRNALEEDLFLPSFAQERLWFLDQLDPNNPVYITYTPPLRLKGKLDLAALWQSVQAVVGRHEVLRTSFVAVEGRPYQAIAPHLELPLPLTDLSGLPESECASLLVPLLQQANELPFDLTHSPLLRVHLLRLAPSEHVLVVTFHHIITDRWSSAIFWRDLSACYGAFTLGQSPALPNLPIQYADYATSQREWLQGTRLEKYLSYWRAQLADAPPLLDLPTDHRRPAVNRYRGAHLTFQLGKELHQALQALSRQAGVTLFMTLLAAFQTLLWRSSGQKDIVVGTPVSGRARVELEGLMGLFVNTLALRTNLSGNLTFLQLLQHVREVCLGAYEHQELPFEKLVEDLNPERSQSYAPLFQVAFAMEHEDAPASVEFPGLELEPVLWENRTAKFDLSLILTDTGTNLPGILEYNTDLFDAETIARLADRYQTLLQSIVAQPEQHLSKLSMLTMEQQERLLAAWGTTSQPAIPDQCLHKRLEAQVAERPDAIALSFEEQQLTYSELDARANQLAHYLRESGVGPEVRVGLCMERSLELVIGLLGILKAGGAYVPLDSTYPQERLAFMVQDAAVGILLTLTRLRDRLPSNLARVLCLDEDWPQLAQQPTSSPETGVQLDNLAYVIYTSGSTGTPKGTLICHRQVLRLFAATFPWFHFSEADTWTLFHSYAFDFSVWELWGALLYGGRLVVVPYWVSRTPELFAELLTAQQVTVLNQTPSAFRQLIQGEQTRPTLSTQSDLRLVIFGGEALELQSLRPWFERHGDQSPQLVNMYGITETTVHVTYRLLAQADLDTSAASPIGIPIPDLQMYVLDAYLQPVPIGVPGELYVGGAGLARGYLNRPDLTAARFVPHPFSHSSGARLYRTGDLVRFRRDGSFEYLGRLDQQVKLRGFRIELGEIESVLTTHPAVSQALVTVRTDTPEEKRLVAYLVSAEVSASPTPAELRQHTQEQLPDYMVPAAFIVLEALPLTPHGKLNHQALPPPDWAAQSDQPYVPPRTATEAQLASLWGQVLHRDPVGIHDNFFDLGGHSLLATQLMARIFDTFHCALPLRTLFEAPTIARFALRLEAYLKEQKSTYEQPTDIPLARGARYRGQAGRIAQTN